jgi:hypothetical protein
LQRQTPTLVGEAIGIPTAELKALETLKLTAGL